MDGEESFELSIEVPQVFKLTRFTLEIGSLQWNFAASFRRGLWTIGSGYIETSTDWQQGTNVFG